MTIIDTSVLIDYLAGGDTPQVEWLERQVGVLPCGIPDLVVYEALQGTRTDKHFEDVRATLQAFAQPVTLTPGLAEKAARNYRSLRQRGITVRATVDTLVATFCIENGHQLLHNDRDFNGFGRYLGLKVVRMDVP
jgi:predicted nucleic acid-binding protein